MIKINNTITFISCLKPSKHVTGSGFCDSITTGYDNLVNLFGEPTIKTDEYKTSSEWHVEVREEGSIQGAVAIYDYKQCKTYAPAWGLDTEDITDWHIGAKDPKLAKLVIDFIKKI
tara:strand:+ start:2169 stop:2516 length:348 start_codon:yes stop_codon:yes gene_type:complete